MIANYSRVQLLTDKYHLEGASKGDTGSVIECYDNGDYEVEFCDENGIDYAQIVAREEELRVLPDPGAMLDAVAGITVSPAPKTPVPEMTS